MKKNGKKFWRFEKLLYLCTRNRERCLEIQNFRSDEETEFLIRNAEIAQLVEHNLAKVGVAGPSPVFRSLVEQKRVVREGPGEQMPRWRKW